MHRIALSITASVLLSTICLGQNLLTNPGFESGLSGWRTDGVGWRTGSGRDVHYGAIGAVCDVQSGQPLVNEWRVVHQEVSASPGDLFRATAWFRTVGLQSSQSIFEIQFLDANRVVLLQFDTTPTTRNQDFSEAKFPVIPAPPRTAWISIRGVVHVPRTAVMGSPEFHAWDDFDLERLSVSELDRDYLIGVARDTWKSIDSLVEPLHGLPYDSSRKGDTTSTTNLGFYITSVVAARQLGFIGNEEAMARIGRVLDVMERLPKWHGFQSTWTNVHNLQSQNDDREHVVSLLDAGNQMASLMVVSQAIPELSNRCSQLLKGMDLVAYYDPASKRLHGGFDIRKNDFVPGWWVTDLGSDSRMVSFLAVGQGVPVACWNGLNRATVKSHGVEYLVPGWTGGGLFMQWIAKLFLDEHTSLAGSSATQFAFDQLAHMGDLQANVWGWSAGDSPRYGYSNTYGMKPHDNLIAPYASVLAIEDWAPAVIQNLRTLESLGGRDLQGHLGFYDGFDTEIGKHSSSFLMLDQSMILMSLCNYLKSGCLRTFFAQAPLAKLAYSKIKDP